MGAQLQHVPLLTSAYLQLIHHLKELFNLQHTKAQNVIERAFGVTKQCFKILVIPPEYQIWMVKNLVT